MREAGSTPTRTTSRVVRRLRCPPTCPRSRARPPPRSARRASPGRFAAAKGARRSRRRRPDSLFPRRGFSFVSYTSRSDARRVDGGTKRARRDRALGVARRVRERERRVSVAAAPAPLRRPAPVAQRATGRIYTRRGSTRFQCSLVPRRASSRAEGIFLEPVFVFVFRL